MIICTERNVDSELLPHALGVRTLHAVKETHVQGQSV